MLACPVCSARMARKFDDLYCCASCQHLCQVPPVVKVHYDTSYVDKYKKLSASSNMSHLRLGLVKAFCASGTLLDVGYGSGDFVRLAVRAGYDAWGLDVHGVDCGVREPSQPSERQWDVVTFFDSLEHFTDLGVAKQLIRKARLVAVSVPCLGSWTEDWIRAWHHYKPGEHLHYFGTASLDHFMQPRLLLSRSDAEDAIRGRHGEVQNILTSVYGF